MIFKSKQRKHQDKMLEVGQMIEQLQKPDLELNHRLQLIEKIIKGYSQVSIDGIENLIKNIRISKASCLSKLKRHKEAFDILQEILEHNPEDVEALTELGYCYMNKGEFASAIPVLKKIVDLDVNNALALYNIGICWFKEDNLKLGIGFLEKSLSIEEDETTYHDLSLAYFNINEKDKAQDFLETGLSKFPDSVSLNGLLNYKKNL